VIADGLAVFALVWALSLWGKTERLRERLGVYFVADATGEAADRMDAGGLGGWLNCPQCTAVLCWAVLRLLGRGSLASLGLALLAVRWWESQRPRARWWE